MGYFFKLFEMLILVFLKSYRLYRTILFCCFAALEKLASLRVNLFATSAACAQVHINNRFHIKSILKILFVHFFHDRRRQQWEHYFVMARQGV